MNTTTQDFQSHLKALILRPHAIKSQIFFFTLRFQRIIFSSVFTAPSKVAASFLSFFLAPLKPSCPLALTRQKQSSGRCAHWLAMVSVTFVRSHKAVSHDFVFLNMHGNG